VNGRAIVIGGSAGGTEALRQILEALPQDFAPVILVVQHLHRSDHGAFARHLASSTCLPVIEPCDKQTIEGGRVYCAPADYHMHVEQQRTVSLSVDPKVNWSRPSIDVLFESAARVWGERLTAVILSGANADGVRGLQAVRDAGGRTVAQDPQNAVTPFMPQAAINAGVIDEVLDACQIGQRLVELDRRQLS
jgi:two-component system chemotaxis response regulator CheB